MREKIGICGVGKKIKEELFESKFASLIKRPCSTESLSSVFVKGSISGLSFSKFTASKTFEV